jgi:hypothetical protein
MLLIKELFFYRVNGKAQKLLSRAGGVAQAVECLPTKGEALSSSPSTTQKKNK